MTYKSWGVYDKSWGVYDKIKSSEMAHFGLSVINKNMLLTDHEVYMTNHGVYIYTVLISFACNCGTTLTWTVLMQAAA